MRRTPLRRQSSDRRVEQAVRRAIAAELGRRPCALRIMNVCTGQAENLHELVGAAQGGSRVDRRGISPCCNRCNSFVEDHPKLAYEKGWKVRREDAMPGNRGLVPRELSPYSVAAIQEGWS